MKIPGNHEKRPRLLALYGSPRDNGFSSYIHNVFSGEMERLGMEVRSYNISSLDIHHCTACGYCRREENDSPCIFHDDMTPLYDDLFQSDIISLSSPVFFSSLPGPVKLLVDRCQAVWEEPLKKQFFIKKRFGYFISTAGSEQYPTMFSSSLTVVKHFYKTINASFDEKGFYLLHGTDTIGQKESVDTRAVTEEAKKLLARFRSE
jgi:multimeric flavodoxin WrbA